MPYSLLSNANVWVKIESKVKAEPRESAKKKGKWKKLGKNDCEEKENGMGSANRKGGKVGNRKAKIKMM